MNPGGHDSARIPHGRQTSSSGDFSPYRKSDVSRVGPYLRRHGVMSGVRNKLFGARRTSTRR